MTSREILISHLEGIKAKGFGSDQIVLLGFSQGAGMCLDVMLHWDEKVAAVVALSGFLMDGDRVRGRSDLATEIPIFAAHGLYDPILPFQRSKESLHVLKKAGFELTWREYPMAHQIVPDEIDDIREFLLRET